MKRLLLLFALVAMATGAVVAMTVSASDHIDSPLVAGSTRRRTSRTG